jgi:ABC-type lipoprotein export system ATPase subunit
VCREHRTTLLIVSHDDAVLDTADRVLDMAALNRARGRRQTATAGEPE